MGIFGFLKKNNLTSYTGETGKFPQEESNIDFYSRVTASELVGGIFWFNWKEISDKGHNAYGRYVYQTFFSIMSEHKDSMFVSFDGDIIGGKSQIPTLSDFSEDNELMNKISSQPLFGLMIAGAFSFNFALLSIHFWKKSIGYLGLTKLGGENINTYFEYASGAMFVNAVSVQKDIMVKKSFGYLSNEEIKAMGYRVY